MPIECKTSLSRCNIFRQVVARKEFVAVAIACSRDADLLGFVEENGIVNPQLQQIQRFDTLFELHRFVVVAQFFLRRLAFLGIFLLFGYGNNLLQALLFGLNFGSIFGFDRSDGHFAFFVELLLLCSTEFLQKEDGGFDAGSGGEEGFGRQADYGTQKGTVFDKLPDVGQ